MADLAPLLGHTPLLTQLERARSLGFLGPGPVTAHIEHTAAFLDALADTPGRIVDLGSGGGVPGLVIGVARPDLEVVLLDATAKRCRFLEQAVEVLALRASVVEGRAEVVGHGPLRGTATAVVARSFGSPAATAECAAPLLARDGQLARERAPRARPRPLAGGRAGPARPGGRASFCLGPHGADAAPRRRVSLDLPPPRRAPGQAAALLTCSTWNISGPQVEGSTWNMGQGPCARADQRAGCGGERPVG